MVGGEVPHIVHGRVLVHQLVHVVAEAIVGGVDAAERQTAAEDVRSAQIQVDCVGGTQTAAKGDDAGQVVPAVALLGQAADLGHGLVHDVVQPLLIAADAPVGVAVGVGPGLLVQRVDGKHHDLAGLDPRGQGVGHVEVLKVKEPAVLTGDVQHGAACMAVDLALHIPAKGGAVILKILHFHSGSSFLIQASPLGEGFYASSSSYISVWNTKGSCFSQLASLWVPPGTMRLVRWMPRVSTLLHISAKPQRMPSWLPISREP